MRWDINFHICPRALKRVNERANKRMSEWLSCYFPIPSRSVPPPDASSFVWWFLSDPDDFVEFWFVDAGHRSRHCHARADASRTGASDRRGCHRRRPPAFRQRAGAKGNRTRWEASDEQWVERQRNQGVELIRSLVPSHSSLIRVLHNARFARALRCASWLARSLSRSQAHGKAVCVFEWNASMSYYFFPLWDAPIYGRIYHLGKKNRLPCSCF